MVKITAENIDEVMIAYATANFDSETVASEFNCRASSIERTWNKLPNKKREEYLSIADSVAAEVIEATIDRQRTFVEAAIVCRQDALDKLRKLIDNTPDLAYRQMGDIVGAIDTLNKMILESENNRDTGSDFFRATFEKAIFETQNSKHM